MNNLYLPPHGLNRLSEAKNLAPEIRNSLRWLEENGFSIKGIIPMTAGSFTLLFERQVP